MSTPIFGRGVSRRFTRASGVVTAAALALSFAACAAAINPQAIEDAQTVARVRSVLVNDMELGTRPVEIRVRGGTAYLTGQVYSDDEARRLIDIVRGVPGVAAVESGVTVSAPPGPGAAAWPAIDDEPPSPGTAAERRLLALGASISRMNPRDTSLDPSVSVLPNIRLGSGGGFGPSVGFNWMSTTIVDEAATGQPLGKVRLRPVMAGVGYSWSGVRSLATVSLVAGYSFNSLSIDDVAPGRPLPVRVDDSFAWRTSLSIWYDLTGRFALHGMAGYLVARPQMTVLDGIELRTRTLRADAPVLRLGLAYKLF